MGAWGTGPFDNDDAGDWLAEFTDEPSLSAIRSAIKAAIDAYEAGYLELTEGGAAVAAVEVLAAMRGKPHGDFGKLDESTTGWVSAQSGRVPSDLVALSLKCLKYVKSDEKSEMHDCWAESDDKDNWLQTIADLESRLLTRARTMRLLIDGWAGPCDGQRI